MHFPDSLQQKTTKCKKRTMREKEQMLLDDKAVSHASLTLIQVFCIHNFINLPYSIIQNNIFSWCFGLSIMINNDADCSQIK